MNAWLSIVLVAIALHARGSAGAEEPPALTDLLAKVGGYITGFARDFTSVISDETYRQRDRFVQKMGSRTRISTTNRTIQSETAFLRIPEDREWLTVRNVLKVDGKRIGDSRARMDEMLGDSTPGASSRFRKLRDESARFNIGGIRRNFGDPTVALQFVDPHHQPRFEFRLDRAETIGTMWAWKLTFAERARPTMIAVDGHDALAFGAIWVTASGVVLRTLLELRDEFTGLSLSMVVTYGNDRKLAGWVPIRMDERYVQRVDKASAPSPIDTLPARPFFGIPFDDEITCTATYTNFRRFETSARLLAPK